MSALFRCAPLFVLPVAALAGYWSFRLAEGDALSTADSVSGRRRAAELVPGDSKKWLRLATLQQQHGIAALPAFARAIQADPLNASAWIGMGLEQEVSGQYESAEQSLLHAAAISREYVPRWTLLNYYFRRNDAEHFWPWARKALNLGGADPQPVFRMAWSLSDDAGVIDRNLALDRAHVLSQYLIWLTAVRRFDAAEVVSLRLLPLANKQDSPALQYYCDRMLAENRLPAAITVWNGIASRHLLDGVEPTRPGAMQNGDFSREPLNSGFGWHIVETPGVTIRSTPSGLRASFSGKQPENCELIFQFVPLEANRKYRLDYEYQTSGISRDSGLGWKLIDVTTGSDAAHDPASLASEMPVRESCPFVTPPEGSSSLHEGRLVLVYRRVPGTTRIEGWLQLKRVALMSAN